MNFKNSKNWYEKYKIYLGTCYRYRQKYFLKNEMKSLKLKNNRRKKTLKNDKWLYTIIYTTTVLWRFINQWLWPLYWLSYFDTRYILFIAIISVYPALKITVGQRSLTIPTSFVTAKNLFQTVTMTANTWCIKNF